MSVNRLKKIILKTNVKKENKYVGSGALKEKNQISDTYAYSINNQKNKSKVNQSKETNNIIENNIETENEEKDLDRELYLLKSKYETEKSNNIDKIRIINNEIKEKNRELKLLSKDNFRLILKLKDIESTLKSDYLKTFNERMKKRNLYIKNEQTLKNDIIVKEEEIKNVKKFVNVEKKQLKQCEYLLNEVNNGMEQNLELDLKELKEELSKLDDELIELYKIKFAHKTCKKNIQSLTNKINLYNTEIEFESKKNGMLINQSSQSIKKLSTNPSKNNDNILNEDNKASYLNKINYSQNIRKIVLKQNIPRPEKLNISTSRYISDKIDLINRTPDKNKKVDDKQKKNINLFTEGEYNFLKKIIPSKYMNRYIDEFDNLKKEKYEIQKTFQNNNIAKDNNELIHFKIEYIGIKKKEMEKRYIQLITTFKKNNKKKNDLELQIKKYENEIKKYNKIIQRNEKMKKVFISHQNE